MVRTLSGILLVFILLNLAGPILAEEIHDAVAAGNVAAVRSMLLADEKGKLLKTKDEQGRYPIQIAIIYNQVEVFDYLADRGAEIDVADPYGFTAFHFAVIQGDVTLAEKVMSRGASPLRTTKYDDTALHLAVTTGLTEMVDLVLERGADLTAVNNDGMTPLHVAVERGDLDMVTHLVVKGADPNLRDVRGMSPLHSAIAYDRNDIAMFLLRNGADQDLRINGKFPMDAGLEGTSLHVAVIYERLALIDSLFAFRPYTAARNKDQFTPVMVAVDKQRYEILDSLLAHGADPNNADGEMAPMDFALDRNDLILAKKLLDAEADVNRPNRKGRTPLVVAVDAQLVDMVDLLLTYRASVVPAEGAENPLEIALDHQNVSIIELLIDHGANVNNIDRKGRTPLYYAVDESNLRLAMLLIEKGADLQFILPDWKTNLVRMAIDKRSLDMVRLLVSNDAVCQYGEDFGKSTISMALAAGPEYLSEVLRSSDLDLRRKDSSGNGYMHLAVTDSKDARAISLLAKRGADINATNNDGQTPLHLAASRGDELAIRMLVAQDADINKADNQGMTPYSLSKGTAQRLLLLFGGRTADGSY